MEKHIDVLVLGCTHYPFARPLIQRILGANVRIIDPAPAVAKQVARILEQHDLNAPADQVGGLIAYTSGTIQQFKALLPKLGVGEMEVYGATWSSGNTELKLGG